MRESDMRIKTPNRFPVQFDDQTPHPYTGGGNGCYIDETIILEYRHFQLTPDPTETEQKRTRLFPYRT